MSPANAVSVAKTECTLYVRVNDHSPKFSFKGHWTGRDLDNVSRLLVREYGKYNYRLRRGEKFKKEEE